MVLNDSAISGAADAILFKRARVTSQRAIRRSLALSSRERRRMAERRPAGAQGRGSKGKPATSAAVKAKGTIFALVYRRLVPRLGHGCRLASQLALD